MRAKLPGMCHVLRWECSLSYNETGEGDSLGRSLHKSGMCGDEDMYDLPEKMRDALIEARNHTACGPGAVG